VGVQVLIGQDGKVKDTRVVKSIPMLDAAVVAAARQWRFKPAHDSNGKPMVVWVVIPFTFRILPPPDSAHAEFDKAVRSLREQISGGLGESIRPPSERDEAAREHVIRMGLRLKPRPTTLREVRTLVRSAHADLDSVTVSSNERALEQLSYALFQAPWYADAYLEAGRALEATGQPGSAEVALRLYLVADSTSFRRKEVEQKMRDLENATRH
jgi:TonB family protein